MPRKDKGSRKKKDKEKKRVEEPTPVVVEPMVYKVPRRIPLGKYLMAKATKHHHIDAMVVHADALGFKGNRTVEEWEKILRENF